MPDAPFVFGDLVRVGLRGTVKWTVVTVGEIGAMVMTRNGATRWEPFSNLRRWQD